MKLLLICLFGLLSILVGIVVASLINFLCELLLKYKIVFIGFMSTIFMVIMFVSGYAICDMLNLL